MHRAYINPNLLDSVELSQDFELDPDTLKRFTRVLRLADGTSVELFDGTGRIITGTLNQKFLKNIQISHREPKGPHITLYQAMVSMDKLEQITQHATELGVSEIVIFKAERSQIDFKDKMPAKLERLTRIAQDASRQCGRADVPDLTCLREGFGRQALNLSFICSPNSKKSLLHTLPSLQGGEGLRLRLLIGPEGGFSPAEINYFKSQGATEISLAPYVLRTETASLAALAQIQGAFL
jgi:16S rRNA (uracil1498-N3)-methyltransferase